MLRGSKTLLIGMAFASAFSGSAWAGGFSRGTADTDILFEDGNFVMRAGALYVAPQRGYDSVTIGGVSTASTDGNYLDSYMVPGVALKLNLTDDVRCAGTYTQPFGANATYGPQAITAGITADALDGAGVNSSGTAYTKFSTDEFGLTCGYKFNAGKGNFWLMGGGFLESISYNEGNRIGNATLGPIGALSLHEGMVPGFRLGAAYEIPEIALRVQAMYRSQVEHNLTGSFSVTGFGVLNAASIGSATMPQSFEVKAQTGIAPTWLAFGSLKWTDWSVLQTLNYTTTGARQKDFFYKDGWTVTGGIGHSFTDHLSGLVSLTWDSGVSTTEDVNKDTFTFATGVSLKGDNGGEFRVGGAVSYLQGGSVAQAATCLDGNATICGSGVGAAYANTVGNDWSFALGASFNLNF
ncbi:outer membrane protein transport protein [Oricola nitratireducens]|uniref:outer membrane protein transport protein n=1 Tax=Oricola nitratireducens TaxID=2775868 RepID=UPI00186910F5|nr:outer membrane protein transport protein [Oricola nitratireducens]